MLYEAPPGPWQLVCERLSTAARSQLEGDTELDAWWSAGLAGARAAWPAIAVADDAFAAFFAAWIEAACPTAAELRRCSLPELYLASACARGDTAALSQFEHAYFGEVDAALARMRASPATRDEVKQLVRDKLFVVAPGESPRIAGYAGRGQLGGLVRVMAVRAAIDLARREKRELLAAEPDPEVPIAGLDPELAHFQQRYQAHFKQAFEVAVSSLSSRERNLIRYQLIDGLSVDQIGALYGTHRATAARWVAAARDELANRTRDELRRRLSLSREEVDGLIRWIQSQLELSLQRLFAAES
jgi:RNA polymerase sigma-70 factor (ECF subfamily)